MEILYLADLFLLVYIVNNLRFLHDFMNYTQIRNLTFHYLKYLTIVLFLAVVDQLLKHWVLFSIPEQSFNEIFPGVFLTNAFNQGVAFSLFSDGLALTRFLIIAAMVSINIVLLYALGCSDCEDNYYFLSITLILSGGISNLLDRLFYGAVLDYIHLSYAGFSWPTIFNFADVCICLGGILLFYLSRNHTLYQENSL